METRFLTALLATSALAGTTRAQLIQPVTQLRTVQAIASVTDVKGTQTDSQNVSAPDFGVFEQTFNSSVNLPGEATSAASASQTSSILSDSIVASATFTALPEVFAENVTAEASGSSYLSVTFDLGVPVDYALTGEVTQTAGAAVATLLGHGTIAQSVSFDGTVPVNHVGTLPAGRYTLQLQGAGIANSTPQSNGETSGGYTIVFQVTSQVPSFCDASDGALAACPCSNPGNPDTGCDLAQSTGGVGLELVSQTASPFVAEWYASGFPSNGTPASVLIRSDSLDPSGAVVFGDGLRCVAAPVVRLSTAFAIGGTAIHTHGHGAPAGDYSYQLWFRNAPPAYCDPTAAFNLSNGRTVTW
jgi:hypothetical protein